MLTKTQAIVLHSLKYGETRMIVDMFTRQFGRLSFIVSMPKSAKSKMKKQFFQPLSLLEIETDVRPKVQLQKLSDVRLASPFPSDLKVLQDKPCLPKAPAGSDGIFHSL